MNVSTIEQVSHISHLSKNISLTVRVLLPTEYVTGTGPENDKGVPSVTSADLEHAQQETLDGQRLVYAQMELFPNAVARSYVTLPTLDVETGVKNAVNTLAGALGELLCEELMGACSAPVEL